MLYFCFTDRRGFGDVSTPNLLRINLNVSPDLGDILVQAGGGFALIAIWSQAPHATGQAPDLLICPDGTEEDWSAWITTFASKIRPFSAYSRLISYSKALRLNEKRQNPDLDHLTWPAAGVILGEVLATSRLPDKTLETVPAAASASMLSFTIFRAVATYSNLEQWSELISAWERVRQITRQRARQIDGTRIARVCATVIAAGGLDPAGILQKIIDPDLYAVCKKLVMSPSLFPASLNNLPYFSSVEALMRGSREDRVVAFMDFAKIASTVSIAQSDEITSFMLGYLASRIAPGTMRHSSLLTPIIHNYPTAMLWYGFCAGLGSNEGVASSLGGRRIGTELPASARRVVRDLVRPEPAVGPPSCDINYLELMALSRTSSDPLEGLITTTQGTANIELAPGIWTVVYSSSKLNLNEDTAPAAPRDNELRAKIGECIELLRSAYLDLGGGDSAELEGRQQSLFAKKRRRGGAAPSAKSE